MSDEWISVRDAAKLTGYNKEHITRLIREGKIEAKKFSIVWQISRDSLQAYIAKAEKLGNRRGPKPKL